MSVQMFGLYSSNHQLLRISSKSVNLLLYALLWLGSEVVASLSSVICLIMCLIRCLIKPPVS